jgi:hypothetical protein
VQARTVSKLLLKSHPDEDEADHTGEQVQDTGVQPDAGQEPQSLVLVHNFVPHKCSHLLQSA